MEAASRSACRALLRECRRLGPLWEPRAPASDLLWGRGFRVDKSARDPLLVQVTPSCLRGSLAAAGGAAFGPWLRGALRGGGGALPPPLLGEGPAAEALLFLRRQGALAACTSRSEEEGLRVDAVSGFVPGASSAGKSQYVFAYNMRFTNSGARRLRVIARQYDFRDSSGALASQIRPEQPEAAGVVGFTPLLEPGEIFEFGSGVVLRSPRGQVMGRFLVIEEPEGLSEQDLQLHKKMEEAELMLRFVYFKGLGTPQFHLPLGQLRFDSEVTCISLDCGD